MGNDEQRCAGADRPGRSTIALSPTRYRRLHGAQVPVWSYLRRKLGKRYNELRTRWRTLRKPALIRLRGVRIAIDPELYSDKIIRRLYDGGYEREECAALERTLRADDIVLELGTGIGYLSAAAAQRVGDARVTTCEANPALWPAIGKIHALNGVRPTLMHGVMTTDSRTTTRRFYAHTRNFWSSSLNEPEGHYEIVDVPALHWQGELERLQPSYLVMDIEGGEIELLEDFDHPSVRRMLIEFHPRKSGESAVERVFDRLASIGFGAARVDPGAQIFYFEREGPLT